MIMAKFHTGYFDDAVWNLPEVIGRARAGLEGVDFDTIVGTGFSGGIVVPALAMSMDKRFLLIRKDGDDSHHRGRLVGQLGERWIFVDDFVSTGRTRLRVIGKVNEAACSTGTPATMVGQYMYQDPFNGSGFEPFNPKWVA